MGTDARALVESVPSRAAVDLDTALPPTRSCGRGRDVARFDSFVIFADTPTRALTSIDAVPDAFAGGSGSENAGCPTLSPRLRGGAATADDLGAMRVPTSP